MEPFKTLDGIVVPIDRANVDTDAIIPKQFLKSIYKTGYGPYLFDEWRYQDTGSPGQDCSTRPLKKEFVLNQERYREAQVLLARENFGCGSSREHAVWALAGYGIRCVIAPSFADIFFGNCGKNGVLAITLPGETIDHLFTAVDRSPGYRLVIDLDSQTITSPGEEIIPFDIEAPLKDRLLNGIDDIGMTLKLESEIKAYEQLRSHETPWLFPDLNNT